MGGRLAPLYPGFGTRFFGFAHFLYIFCKAKKISNARTRPRGAALGSLCVKQGLPGACHPRHGGDDGWGYTWCQQLSRERGRDVAQGLW